MAYVCGTHYPQTVLVSPEVSVIESCGSSNGTTGMTISRTTTTCTGGSGTCVKSAASYTLAPAMAACDVGEWQVYYPASLDIQGGISIASAICATWAVAWAFRALYRLFNSDGAKEEGS